MENKANIWKSTKHLTSCIYQNYSRTQKTYTRTQKIRRSLDKLTTLNDIKFI